MKTGTSRISRLAVLALSALLASAPALADKGGKHGKGQDNSQGEDRDDRSSYGYGSGGPRERGYGYGNPPPEHGYGYVAPPLEHGPGHDRGPEHGYSYGSAPERGYPPGGPAVTIHFGDSDRYIINDYYGGEFSRGHCPPGLARKHNGCMPPGHAREWHRGHPLPREVVYYPLPYDLIQRLPPPPPRHRYVRVGGDVLLLSGSSVVVDAIIDIGR